MMGQRSQGLIRCVLSMLVGTGGSGCARPKLAEIGYAADGGLPNAGNVAEMVLDSTAPPGTPRIRIVTGYDVSSTQPGGALMGEVDKAVRFAQDPKIAVVVGPGGSREALQTAPIYRQAGLANVDPISTSRLIHAVGPWTFMLAADDSVQGEFIGSFVAERLHAVTALLFYIPDEYGIGLATGTKIAFAKRGVRLLGEVAVRTRQSCRGDSVNPYDAAVATVLREGAPEAIVIAGRTIEAACVAKAVMARHPGSRFVAGDGVLVDAQFVQLAGPAADSMYLVAFWHPTAGDSLSRAFVARFTRLVGRAPRHDDAMYYDAVMLVAQAIRTVGSNRAAIRRYLEELGRTRPPYQGITGSLAFTLQARRPLLMTRVRQGVTQPVP